MNRKIKASLFLAAPGLLIGLLNNSYAFGDRASECSRLWQLEKDAGCPAMPPENSIDAYPTKSCDDFRIGAEFGPTKCIIEENVNNERAAIKRDCDNWVKERRADLGSKFLTSTCNPSCTPCPGNELLRRCTFHGEVHYSNK